MSYSVRNPAWHRLQQSRADNARENEIDLALAIRRECPTLTWGQAMREAARIAAAKAAV